MPEDQRTVIAREALKGPGPDLSNDQWLERYEEALNAIVALASLPQARSVGDEEVEKIARELFERHHVYPGYNDETRERLYQSRRASLIDQVRLVASALATLPPAPGWRGADDAPTCKDILGLYFGGADRDIATYHVVRCGPDNDWWCEGFSIPGPHAWQPLPSSPSPSEEVG